MNYPYGKNVFLTGGSSGIGLSSASLLAKNGYTVYAASRSPQAKTQTFPGGGGLVPVKMDVCDDISVEKAIDNLLQKTDIGIIIHSAGIGIACPGENFPSKSVLRLMDTNFLGVLRVNSRLLPHLRKRGGGICIMVSSVAGLFPIPYQSHYCSSKSALEAYAGALRMEVSNLNIKISLVLPGDTNTGFTHSRSYEFDENSPYHGACLKAVSKMEKDELAGRPPESVARIIHKLCHKKNPPFRSIVGFDYKFLAFLRRFLPDRLTLYILNKMY